MGLQTDTNTNSVTQHGDPSGGLVVGNTSGALLGFYGKAPAARPVGFTALTDSSGGTAAAGTGIQALTSTYNSALIVNGISTCAAAINLIMSNLRAVGIIS